ncbi:helix-turn-helix transcriptional regulator [Maribacter flavus]|uniref:Helix-turn-helix transcriptional regulator n=1 Tax=Maribacter flavus TaxID=1658664 RepID=A0A5B2U1C0_9FLAO|nr:AraC family transcriptional regulator [Maribacter flavus]KAA2219850.1 helix-turn-helix transcriptional regulator [Maribacter flavus]
MITIKTTGNSTRENVRQIQEQIGGVISERWGEFTLLINNENATGNIRFISFEWGVTMLEYNITFHEDVIFESNYADFSPIRFYYCLKGQCGHRFGNQLESELRQLEQFQSVIIANMDNTTSLGYFEKGVELSMNVILITRRKFLKKRLNGVQELNKRLYDVFMDTDHERKFAFFGSYNLKLANKISALRKVRSKNGMIRIMQIEGLVYEILAMHIAQHEKESKNSLPSTSLLRRELKIIRDLANSIAKNVSKDYTLEQLARESGLSQAKLQEGFKLLYARTVTEYIRHVRLEAARDFLRNSDMNISQVVYSIGFSSRSYFSKIFKNKYDISPSEFQAHVKQALSLETI